ncbi:hypothetical protein M7I_4402 [Glarea lozoyensis 74030]|uniref:Uncharacterized protein n=1 Tax=Glarea lozoyensis (strain ATCC 74030 / MF5533) TaxID=1104152 RepID=H0EP34_GLAL7|nr:hypothetical protein M7I_4402 [Glarea lozoyensis 74030]
MDSVSLISLTTYTTISTQWNTHIVHHKTGNMSNLTTL